MKDTAFLNVSAYVRVREKYLLDSQSIDRIADASTTQEALRMISQNSDYDFSTLRRPEDSEEILGAELRKVYAMAGKVASACPAVVETAACKYDYHNVKVALKAKYLGQTEGLPFVEATGVPRLEILKFVEKFDSKSNLPANLQLVARAGAEAFDASQNPQMIDIALDKLMYAHMLETAAGTESKFITGYVKASIDFYNVKTLVRVKNMQKGTAFLGECLAAGGNTGEDFFLANYSKTAGALALSFAFKSYGGAVKEGLDTFEKTGNYSGLERQFDNYLIDYVKNAKRVSFGPEILFSYLISKENEIRQIRIVVACKNNQIAPDILKERLRDNYV